MEDATRARRSEVGREAARARWAGHVPTSPGPRRAIDYANCSHCSRLYVVRRRIRPSDRLVCRDPECRRAENARRMRSFQRRWTAENGEPYTARYREKRRESDRRAIAEGRGPRHRDPAGARAADLRRRARRRGAEVEQFDKMSIFERDAWRCGICDGPVDPMLKYPDPMSASLDHIVPLARGGSHTRANTQCAHLRCNLSKGDRIPA